jgi:hypothetical protein
MIEAMTRWLLIVCIAACGHAAPPAPVAAKQPSSCEQVADHVVSLMSVAQKAKPEELDPFRNVITKRCTEDHWSAEAQQCLGGIKTLPEGDQCEKLLTEEQAQALERDGQATAGAVAPAKASAASAMQPVPPPPPPSPKSKATRSKGSAPGATSDPCEGGE